MTWNENPVVDGARLESHTLRRNLYMETGGAEGIATPGELKVLPLATPGNGLRITAGSGALLNRYQTAPNQSYAVSNDGEDVVDASRMPAANASARSHLVVVTVGDPEFSQVGHPWMPATLQEIPNPATFNYVRVVIIENVPATTTHFGQLNKSYPGLAIARLDVPANTTTIQAQHIVDLRTIVRPRVRDVVWHVDTPAAENLASVTPTYEYFPNSTARTVAIPPWATHVLCSGFVEGVRISKQGTWRFRVAGPGGSTPNSTMDDKIVAGSADRRSINVGGEFPIAAQHRGTNQLFRIEATNYNSGSVGGLAADSWTTAMVQLRFEERVV